MKTSDLISVLAETSEAAPRGAVGRRLWLAAAGGAAVSLTVLDAWLGMGRLSELMGAWQFGLKAAYTLALTVAAALLLARLARPGGRGRWAMLAIAVAVAGMLALGVAQLMEAEPQSRMPTLMGHSARMCPWRILALAAPVYVGLVWALRRLAPTRPALAGAAAGLLAGAISATVYQAFCRESAPAFIAAWYTLGIVISAGVGGLLGARLLRW